MRLHDVLYAKNLDIESGKAASITKCTIAESCSVVAAGVVQKDHNVLLRLLVTLLPEGVASLYTSLSL